MCSYLHTITYMTPSIEKVSLWIKIKQKDLETHIDHVSACVLIAQKRGLVTAYFRQESRYLTETGKLSTRP